jgi:hypothetical protein
MRWDAAPEQCNGSRQRQWHIGPSPARAAASDQYTAAVVRIGIAFGHSELVSSTWSSHVNHCIGAYCSYGLDTDANIDIDIEIVTVIITITITTGDRYFVGWTNQ